MEAGIHTFLNSAVFRIVLTAFLAAAAFVVYIRFLEKSTLFLPSPHIASTPQDIGLTYEDVYFKTIDKVRLNGWLVRAPEAVTTILFVHGNAGNMGDRLSKIALFNEMGLNVFIFDYRGFGKSRGRPSEQGIYYDALAAYDYLRNRKDISNERIVVYGVSMGGTAAVELALRRKTGALILDSTFTSAADMAKAIFPAVPSFLLSVKLDNIGKIKDVTGPKLFIHSPEDEVVPFALGKKLFDAAPKPKYFLEIKGDHNAGFMESPSEFTGAIGEFLEKYYYL